MTQDNQQLRSLLTLPPPLPGVSGAVVKAEMPAQMCVTCDAEVDAVLWLENVVKTGEPDLIDKALEAVQLIKTPMETLGTRYARYLVQSGDNTLSAALRTMHFGDLERQAPRAIEKARGRREALAMFGTEEALLADTAAETACIEALAGLTREHRGYDYVPEQAANRFARLPALAPVTASDCLHALAYWEQLAQLRHNAMEMSGDPWPECNAHKDYCRAMLATIAPASLAEAIAVLQHLDSDDDHDWEEMRPVIGNLIASGWAASEQGEQA